MARSVRELMQALLDEAAVSVDEVAVLLSLSRHSAYEGVKAGEIPSVRIGRRVLVPTAGLRAMLGIERREPENTGHHQDQPNMTKACAPVNGVAKGGRLRALDTPHQSLEPPVRKAATPRLKRAVTATKPNKSKHQEAAEIA
jgi:excisionase family DNA binding protein